MNPYVIDISSSRVQNAMSTLGIHPSELQNKVFEDFATKDPNNEIKLSGTISSKESKKN